MTPGQLIGVVLVAVLALVGLVEVLSAAAGAWRRWRAEVDDPLDVEDERWAAGYPETAAPVPAPWRHICRRFPGQYRASMTCEPGQCCPWCGEVDPSMPAADHGPVPVLSGGLYVGMGWKDAERTCPCAMCVQRRLSGF